MKVIRLYDKYGVHVLSLVDEPAFCNEIDLATPDGEVEYCGVPRDLFEVFEKHMKVEEIAHDKIKNLISSMEGWSINEVAY
jgi:hypothetical protein